MRNMLNAQVLSMSFFFLLKSFGGHQSFLWCHWYSCFGPLMMSALSFKALACLLCCLCAMDSLDSPLVQHLLTSWQPAWWPSHFWSMYLDAYLQTFGGLNLGLSVRILSGSFLAHLAYTEKSLCNCKLLSCHCYRPHHTCSGHPHPWAAFLATVLNTETSNCVQRSLIDTHQIKWAHV